MLEPTDTVAGKLKTGALPQGYELTQDDVGLTLSQWDGFGPVLESDVGKRVWLKPYGLVMENVQQRDARKGISN